MGLKYTGRQGTKPGWRTATNPSLTLVLAVKQDGGLTLRGFCQSIKAFWGHSLTTRAAGSQPPFVCPLGQRPLCGTQPVGLKEIVLLSEGLVLRSLGLFLPDGETGRGPELLGRLK